MIEIVASKIVTHVNPDLDGMLSIHLLRTYGEPIFSGISTAPVDFVSANELPDGLSPAQLERQGIIAVDVGGGRFDSHPTKSGGEGKVTRAAADLVAEKLGLLEDEKWHSFIEYTRMHDTAAHGLYSSDPMHHIFSLNSILEGITLLHENDSKVILEKGIDLIKVIPSYMENIEEAYPKEAILELVRAFFAFRGIDPTGEEEEYEHFRKWYQFMQENPDLTCGKHPLDKLVSLRSLLQGAHYLFIDDATRMQAYTFDALEAILLRELQWYTAVKQYRDEAVGKKFRDLLVSTISSPNGMVIKASRFVNNPDVLIYHNPDNGAVTLFIQRRGKLNKYPFENIVSRIRLAEAIMRGEKINYDTLPAVGTHQGWFFHQSRNLLIRGSRKSTDFTPTVIPLTQLGELVYSEFDRDGEYNLPLKFMEAWLKFKNPLFRK